MKHLTIVQATCGLQILARKLEAVAKEESAAGLPKSAAATIREKEYVEGLMTKTPALVRKDEDSLDAHERGMLRTAVSMLARNTRAAAGTVTALGRSQWADELTAEADALEVKVLPQLEEQTSLKLAAGDK